MLVRQEEANKILRERPPPSHTLTTFLDAVIKVVKLYA